MTKEASARILINELLQRSGWRFFDDENGSANISLETNVKLKKKILDDLGEDFEKTAHGFIDYLLLDERGFPVAVLEAKSKKFDPLVGKEQARKYAQSQNVRFILLSNGCLHYFWDLEHGNPVLITEFPRPESFDHFNAFKPNPPALVDEKIRFLLNPVVVDARTDITTELLADEGYSVMKENADGELVEQFFFGRDFEKKFFSDETNRVFCETFMKSALRDPLSGELGKTIIFCVRQDHATRIAQTLNEMAHALFPGKYQSDFAVQVSSNIQEAQQMAVSFANNNLNGHTRFLEGYISSKTRVCVTVGMMTTGYDCEDLLNIVMLRPIFSPTDFIQIKGRGTRKFTFRYTAKEDGQVQEHAEIKKAFKLFDFFAVCEYFESKFNYDEVIELPPILPPSMPEPTQLPPMSPTGGYTNINPDPLKTEIEYAVPVYGMKIDRKFFEKFEDRVKTSAEVCQKYEQGDVKGAEELVIAELFNKPDDFFDLNKLRKAVQLDRRITLREILAKVFGDIDRFKTKDELLEEELAKFISIHKPDAAHIAVVRQFFKAYLTDGDIRAIVDSKEFARLADNPKISLGDIKALNGWRDVIPEYVKDYVSLNAFAA